MAPINVTVDGVQLHRFLKKDDYESADEGWWFDGETRQAKVHYRNPQDADYNVDLEFTMKDLISIQ